MFFVGKIIYVHLKRRLISAYLKVSLFYPMYWYWNRFLLPQFVTAQNAQVWLNGCCIFSHIPVKNVDVYVFPLHNWRMNIPSVISWAGLSLLLLTVTSMCVMSSLPVIILVIFCFALWNCRTGMTTEAVTLQESLVILWLGKQVEQSWAILSLDYTFCVCMSTKAPSDVNFIIRWWAQGSVCTSACLSVNCDCLRRVVITVLQLYMLMCGWSIAALRVHVCNGV